MVTASRPATPTVKFIDDYCQNYQHLFSDVRNYIVSGIGKIQGEVAQLYSLRNWIEYGFKQVKNELGWTDYRLTDYYSIERWWELVFSAYLLISMHEAIIFKFWLTNQLNLN